MTDTPGTTTPPPLAAQPAPAVPVLAAPPPATQSAPIAPDAAAQLAAVNAKLEGMVTAMTAELPEPLRALVPASLSPAEKLEWLTNAKKAGIFTPNGAPVPTTDAGKPKVTPTTPDLSKLPPSAKLAAGYGTTKR